MLSLYKPELDELWFKQKLLTDPDTMSYNNKWGGTISFPQEKWKDWYERWVCADENERFYRYLSETSENKFVGEAAYHYDDQRNIFLCDIIVYAEYRGKGYGTEGLRLLCEAAKGNGVDVLYDDIAADNPSVKLFLDNGFTVDHQTEDIVTVKRELGLRIRAISDKEYYVLEDFLYEAIFVPKGVPAPPREIIYKPELQVYVADFGTRKGDMGLVAEADNKIIGAVWVRIMNDYGHIDDETPSFAISLYKAHRGRGIGTALMKKMLELLDKAGYKQASLAVQKENYAVKLYKKVGFEIIDENEEEYIMLYKF